MALRRLWVGHNSGFGFPADPYETYPRRMRRQREQSPINMRIFDNHVAVLQNPFSWLLLSDVSSNSVVALSDYCFVVYTTRWTIISVDLTS